MMFLYSLIWCLGITSGGHAALSHVENCGESNILMTSNRIVGGRNSLPGEFPWQVSLRYGRLGRLFRASHICGATILDPWWIVTAAHCVHKTRVSNLGVAVGMYRQDDRRPTTIGIAKVVEHKQYSPKTLLNDIALLRVKKRLTLGAKMNAICLPHSKEEYTGKVTVTGWGATTEGGSGSNILQAVDLPVIPPNKCEQILGNSYWRDGMICAGFPEGGKDSCQGDSGGPLIQRLRNDTAVLVGVVSFGIGCARPRIPGVYTKVSKYINWIKENTV